MTTKYLLPISLKSYFFICLLCLSTLLHAQTTSKRFQKAEERFDNALLEVFIHPEQLTAKGQENKHQMIEFILARFEEDFVDLRIEKAFKNSPETNFFRPVFIFDDGKRVPLWAFEIMR